jgi:hypothetical protein
MKNLPARACRVCESACREVSIHEGDGRVEIEGYYCENKRCRLRGRNQLDFGIPGLHETEFRGDGSARYTTFGSPGSGRRSELPTCRIFVEVLRQAFGLPIGEVEEVNVQNDQKVDARAPWPQGGWLNMQVTRALPEEDYRALADDGEIERIREAADPVELLRRAIEKKHSRARADITLLIDGRHAVDLAFLATPINFDRMHGDWAREQGWESIWVVGPSFATRLDSNQHRGLPTSWPATRP